MCVNLEIQTVCTKFFENLHNINQEQNDVYCTILYFIHSAPNLSALYFNWSDLRRYEKFTLNIQMNKCLVKTAKFVYPPVVRAFDYWDMLQDVYGAPGYSSNPLTNELSIETDTNVVKTLLIMEKTINQIYIKRKLLTEMSDYKNPHYILHNYKWRIIMKNMNKIRSNSSHKRSKLCKHGEKNNEENSSDLNGCGDTSWFTNLI